MNDLSPLGRLERILVSTDGSEYSDGAVRVGIDAARKCSSQLTALTIVISNPEVEAIAPQIVAKGEMRAKAILDAVERQAKAAGVSVERLVRHGQDPGHQIVRQAEKRNIDLIVMGRRGVRGLARMFVGEATVKVCGQAPCSVLVVPRSGKLPSNRILLATDGSRYSDAAAVMTETLARRCALPVSIVSVTIPGHSDARRAEASAAVARVKDAFVRAGIDADGETVHAERPELGIVETAKKVGADLIVVGSHGRSGLIEKVMIGSVSERVIGATEWPVMVVKAG